MRLDSYRFVHDIIQIYIHFLLYLRWHIYSNTNMRYKLFIYRWTSSMQTNAVAGSVVDFEKLRLCIFIWLLMYQNMNSSEFLPHTNRTGSDHDDSLCPIWRRKKDEKTLMYTKSPSTDHSLHFSFLCMQPSISILPPSFLSFLSSIPLR